MADEEKCDSSDKEENNESDQGQGELHMKSDLRYRRQLVSCSEALLGEDYELIESVYVDNFAVSAWDNISPNPKYIQPLPKKKKVESTAGAEDEENLTSSRSSLPAMRNYELDFVSCPAWKMGIEPMTYRYIPNNGRYRAYKLAKRLDTPKAFKKSFSSSKLSTDQNYLHKEIQRELRKEFELFISLERQKSSLQRQQEAKQKFKEEKLRNSSGTNQPEFSADDYNKKQNKDIKSTSVSSREFKTPDKGRANERPRRPSNLPPLSMQHLTKEQGEYYLEQVSSRLRELEIDRKSASPEKKYEEEGYLSASGYNRRSQSDPVSLNSPRDMRAKNSINHFNKTKKLPTINDHAKELVFEQTYQDPIARIPSIPNRTDSFSNELKISKFSQLESVNNSVETFSTGQEKTKETVKTTGEQPRPESEKAKDSAPVYTHPLMYQPMNLSKVSETIYSESPSHSISKRALRKTKSDSGHIQLFSEYKLRKASENPFDEVDPETVQILDNIRSSYNVNESLKDDDDISLESRAIDTAIKDFPFQARSYNNMRYVDPRGQNMTPNYEDYAKSQVLRNDSGKSQKEIEELHKTVTSKDFVTERRKIGANPYINKSRVTNPGVVAGPDAVGLNKPLQGVPLLKQSKPTKHASVRGNIMPEVMVRRAEIAVTNKRII